MELMDAEDRHHEPSNVNRRWWGYCDECGALAPLNRIYEQLSADVIGRLCDRCRDERIERLDAMYRGE